MCAAGLWWCSLAPRSCVSRPPRVPIVVCCVGDAWWRLTDFARVRVLKFFWPLWLAVTSRYGEAKRKNERTG